MKIAIIKYNAGNITSVDYALRRLGVEPIITDDVQEIGSADKVIFPGVGEAKTTMQYLKNKQLDKLIVDLKQPVLGICLGLQLMCKHSQEGDTECLGIFPIEVKKFQPTSKIVKVPHMGWNALFELKSPLFKGIEESSFVYFVHSFYAELSAYTIAECEYLLRFSAALQKDNFYATQFHPEKSADIGSKLLENFISL
ncbi:MAG: imidazole glycerol phosphate synthase subunit HisH [Chitinophagales bacterium]